MRRLTCIGQLNTRSTQPCIPPGSLNRVPASAGGKGGNVTSAGWQVTLCDPKWHVSSRSGVATLRTAIHLLLTYFLTYFAHALTAWRCHCFLQRPRQRRRNRSTAAAAAAAAVEFFLLVRRRITSNRSSAKTLVKQTNRATLSGPAHCAIRRRGEKLSPTAVI